MSEISTPQKCPHLAKPNHARSVFGLSLVLLLSLSGCRFGNHVNDGPASTDHTSGYYLTQPASFTISTSQTGGGSHTVDGDLSQIPGILGNYFTNPASLVFNPATGGAAVFPPMNGSPTDWQSISFESDNIHFAASSETNWEMAWTDQACLMKTQLFIEGAITPLTSSDPSTVSTSIGTIAPKGHLGFSATYQTIFQGDCTASWQAMADCYNNVSSCPGSSAADQSHWHDLVDAGTYQFYIQTGAMTPDEIPTTQSMGFEATYQ